MTEAATLDPAPSETSRRRVLFVDDEQSVLDGLKNLLWKQRREWEMVFALGGEAALVELGRAPFDVVVADMRMPGMDGAALLQRVKELHPASSRIVLSGHAERDAIVRSLPVAHQFLSKPCDAGVLRIVIERTCALGDLLRDDAIRRVVGKLDRLPSVPETYWKLARAIAEPGVSVAEVAAIIRTDPGMGIKVLQLVNSAYFSLARRTTSIEEGVRHLGTELLKGLALTSHVFAMAEVLPVEGFSLDEFQRHSLLTARLARRFAGEPETGEAAFTAGLVHDVGKLIVALGMPEEFRGITSESRSSGRPAHRVERERLGVSHAEIGAYLIGIWGLPLEIVEAVAFHHSPGRVRSGPRTLVAAIHLADAFANGAGGSSEDLASGGAIDVSFLESAGLGGRVEEWRAAAEKEILSLKDRA